MLEQIKDMIKAIRDWSNSRFQPKGDYLTEVPEEYALLENTGYSLSLNIDKDYVMTIELKNADGDVLSSKSIDFPIESMVVGADYADGELLLTLQNGQELPPIDISDIVKGLVKDTFTIAGIDMKDDITKEELVTALGINNKVDKVSGKGLSTNDFTDEDKSKLDSIPEVTPISKGGTGKTTAKDAANIILNGLDNGSDTAVLTDDNIFISESLSVKGTYTKRKLLILWNYIKTKAESVFVKKSGDTMDGILTINNNDNTNANNGIRVTKKGVANLFFGMGSSGNRGIYDNTLAKWILTTSESGVKLTGNADTATKATQDKDGNDIDSTYLKASESKVKKKYTVNLSSYSTDNFYLVTFPQTPYEIDCEIYSPGFPGSAAYNYNTLHFLLTYSGWNDIPLKFNILNHSAYSESEITIASIVGGDHAGGNGVYLRGGLTYTIYSNHSVTLHTSRYTLGDQVFPSGTATCYNTGFTNVSLLMDFTTTDNAKKFSRFSGELRAGSFVGSLTGNAATATKATQDNEGNPFLSSYMRLAQKNIQQSGDLYINLGVGNYLCFAYAYDSNKKSLGNKNIIANISTTRDTINNSKNDVNADYILKSGSGIEIILYADKPSIGISISDSAIKSYDLYFYKIG